MFYFECEIETCRLRSEDKVERESNECCDSLPRVEEPQVQEP